MPAWLVPVYTIDMHGLVMMTPICMSLFRSVVYFRYTLTRYDVTHVYVWVQCIKNTLNHGMTPMF